MQTWVLAVIAFAEAFLTTFATAMGAVWTIQGNQWPSLPSIALGTVGGLVAGFRRLGAFYKIPVAALMILAFTGCTTLGQPINLSSGVLPSFTCKGKGTITANVGALGSAATTLMMDCGDGLTLQQIQPAPAIK